MIDGIALESIEWQDGFMPALSDRPNECSYFTHADLFNDARPSCTEMPKYITEFDLPSRKREDGIYYLLCYDHAVLWRARFRPGSARAYRMRSWSSSAS